LSRSRQHRWGTYPALMSSHRPALDSRCIKKQRRLCNRWLGSSWNNERKSRINFFVLGLNDKTAPVELREQLAVKQGLDSSYLQRDCPRRLT
jgi:hypothetical protein